MHVPLTLFNCTSQQHTHTHIHNKVFLFYISYHVKETQHYTWPGISRQHSTRKKSHNGAWYQLWHPLTTAVTNVHNPVSSDSKGLSALAYKKRLTRCSIIYIYALYKNEIEGKNLRMVKKLSSNLVAKIQTRYGFTRKIKFDLGPYLQGHSAMNLLQNC